MGFCSAGRCQPVWVFAPVSLRLGPLSWCFSCFQGKGWAGRWVGESEARCQLLLWSGACGWWNSEGKEGLRQTDGCLLDCICILALLAAEWLAGCGSPLALSSAPWKTQPARTPDCWMWGREGERSTAANRLISLDQTFRIANTHFWTSLWWRIWVVWVCVREWSRLSWKLEEGDEEA